MAGLNSLRKRRATVVVNVNAFSFTSSNLVEGRYGESALITITTTGTAAVTITNGQASINGGGWFSGASTITNGQTIKLRNVAPSEGSAATVCSVIIGNKSATWSLTGYVIVQGMTAGLVVDFERFKLTVAKTVRYGTYPSIYTQKALAAGIWYCLPETFNNIDPQPGTQKTVWTTT